MPLPTGGISTANLDQGTDSPANARAQLLQTVQAVNDLVAMFGQPLGVALLDAAGLLPAAQVPSQFLTGMGMEWWSGTLPTGWLWQDGRTIGNASSGATARANADCQALFTALWSSTANTELAVSGGRGASAAADWAAGKTIALPDRRGRVGVGRDDMGGTAASRLTTAGSGIDGTKLGAAGGAETVALTAAQIPAHSHPINNGNTYYMLRSTGGAAGVTSGTGYIDTMTNTSNNTGGGGAHNNTQPAIVCNYIIKL